MCPNIINFGAVDFSEHRHEEVIKFLLTLSVVVAVSTAACEEAQQRKHSLNQLACCEGGCYGNAGDPEGSDVMLLQCIEPNSIYIKNIIHNKAH